MSDEVRQVVERVGQLTGRKAEAKTVKLRDDGKVRSDKEQRDIDLMFARVFVGQEGDRLLRYLRSITIENVSGPGLDACALRHLEGQRYLCSVIDRAIKRGRSQR